MEFSKLRTLLNTEYPIVKTLRLSGVCLLALAACLLSRGVRAQQFVLDTGAPVSGNAVILSNGEWFAAEFYATAGETITELSAYLTSMTGNGNNFAFDIYVSAGGSFLTTRNAQLNTLLAFSATGTFQASGWSTTAVDWVVPESGDYWLAIEGDSTATHNKPTFDVQEETSLGTGTVPALAFAYDTGTEFATSGAVPIGLEVTAAAAVPEPSGWWFLAAGGIVAFCLRGGHRRGVVMADPYSYITQPVSADRPRAERRSGR
jgi:hypothetical protein